jgi:hypothetical protein
MSASATKIRRVAVEVETVELSALLSVADCCALLGDVDPKTVMGYIRSGELRAMALGVNGGKPYRVEVADFQAFKESRRVRPVAAVVELVPEPAPVVKAASREQAGSNARRSSGSRRRRASTGLIAA